MALLGFRSLYYMVLATWMANQELAQPCIRLKFPNVGRDWVQAEA